MLLALIAAAHAFAQDGGREPSLERQKQLIHLVRQDCGSCHGLRLGGGLGPALTPAALADKPAASLKATILFGRPGTAMPPWQAHLTDAEASWIVTALQKGFPDVIPNVVPNAR